MPRQFTIALALWGLAALSPASAQAPDAEKPAFERTPEMEAAEAIALAASLAAYGRRTESAQALVTAAALLIDNPVSEGRLMGTDGAPVATDDIPPLTPSALLDEAEALAGPDDDVRPQIAALRARAPEGFPPVRGAERGPFHYAAAADGRDTQEYKLVFRGREMAMFQLRGDGSSDLDYYLYDINGELVASSDGPSDADTLFWNVPYRQELTLRVRNRGTSRNVYRVITN